jgi:hypothetical protein
MDSGRAAAGLRTVFSVSYGQRLAPNVIAGTWGAAAAAWREDWDGFDVLLGDALANEACANAWATAAITSTAALLRLIEVDAAFLQESSRYQFAEAVTKTLDGDAQGARECITDEINAFGTGVVLGQALGGLTLAAALAADLRDLDVYHLLQRMCSVASGL